MAPARPDWRFALALASLTLIGPLAIHLFLPLMPAIKTEFAVSSAGVQLAFSITLATMAAVTLFYGSLSDRYGRRPVLLAGLGLFLIGSAVSALAASMPVLVIGRLVQALGAGSGATLTRAIARDAYGAEGLVKAIAYLTMAYTLGPMIAPVLGGVLLDHFGWRSAFWLALLLGAAITAAAFCIIAETRRGGEVAARPAGLLRNYLTLFAQPRFTAFVLQSGLCSGTFFTIAAASPFFMTERLGRSATEYGLWFLLFPAGYCLGNLISSRLSGRVAIETMVLAGSVLPVLALGVQAALLLDGLLLPAVIFLPACLVSFSQGIALPNAQAGAIQVAPDLAGTASGIGVFSQMFLSAAFAQLYGLIADGTTLPMILISGSGAILTLLVGAVPYLLRRARLTPRAPLS